MHRTLFYLFVLAAVCLGGDLQVVHEPAGPITKRVLLVVDVSGSMKSANRITDAIEAIKTITQQPIDEMEFGLLVFSDQTRRWPGIPEEGVPKGWAALPSDEAIKSAQEFVESNVIDSNTLYTSALTEALNEKRDNLSIVLISDGLGLYSSDLTAALASCTERQAWREQAGLGKAVIYVINIGKSQDWLTDLAKIGGGGHYRIE